MHNLERPQRYRAALEAHINIEICAASLPLERSCDGDRRVDVGFKRDTSAAELLRVMSNKIEATMSPARLS